MSIQILKETVEAKTRRLSARWTFEAAQDAEAMHGVDVEAEIMQALAQEIVVEIDQEIIGSLRTLAGAGTTLDFKGLAWYKHAYVGDRHALLAIEIPTERLTESRLEQDVVLVTILLYLQKHLQFYKVHQDPTFARTTEGSSKQPTNTKFVGTLNGTIRVFADNYAADGTKVLSWLQRTK